MTNCIDQRTDEELDFYEQVDGILVKKSGSGRRIAHFPQEESEENRPVCFLNKSEEFEWRYKDIPGQVPKGFYEVCCACMHEIGVRESDARWAR